MADLGYGAFKESSENFQGDLLKMAMLNRQIEARQQELQQQHQLSMESGEDVGSLLKTLVPNVDTSALEGRSFPQGTISSLLQAEGNRLRTEALTNKPQSYFSKPDSNGIITHAFVNPFTGEPTPGSSVSQTLEPQRMEKIAASDAGGQSALATIQGMAQRLQKVLTSNPAYVPGQEAKIKLQQLIPFDPELKSTMDGMASRVMQIQKNLSGTAGRNWEMIQAEMRGYGDGSDTVQSALMKLNDKMQDIKNTMSATHMTYDPSNFLKSSIHPTAQGAQVGQATADPYAGMSTQDKMNLLMQRLANRNKQNQPQGK